MALVGQAVSEKKIFEIVDGRTTDRRRTDGRTPDHGHPISSPCEPNGSGELTTAVVLNKQHNRCSVVLCHYVVNKYLIFTCNKLTVILIIDRNKRQKNKKIILP